MSRIRIKYFASKVKLIFRLFWSTDSFVKTIVDNDISLLERNLMIFLLFLPHSYLYYFLDVNFVGDEKVYILISFLTYIGLLISSSKLHQPDSHLNYTETVLFVFLHANLKSLLIALIAMGLLLILNTYLNTYLNQTSQSLYGVEALFIYLQLFLIFFISISTFKKINIAVKKC